MALEALIRPMKLPARRQSAVPRRYGDRKREHGTDVQALSPWGVAEPFFFAYKGPIVDLIREFTL